MLLLPQHTDAAGRGLISRLGLAPLPQLIPPVAVRGVGVSEGLGGKQALLAPAVHGLSGHVHARVLEGGVLFWSPVSHLPGHCCLGTVANPPFSSNLT